MTEPSPSHINLPHAATIAGRLIYYLKHRPLNATPGMTDVRDLLEELESQLRKYEMDPPAEEAIAAARRLSKIARTLADEIVRAGFRGDRLGQCVRNLFECLGYPEEGAERSIACGERPDSPLRP